MGIFGIVLMIAVPTWLKQRELARGTACQENLKKIDSSKEQYALETNTSNGSTVSWDVLVKPDRTGYLQATPQCPANGSYTLNPIGQEPVCSYNGQEVYSRKQYKHMLDPVDG